MASSLAEKERPKTINERLDLCVCNNSGHSRRVDRDDEVCKKDNIKTEKHLHHQVHRAFILKIATWGPRRSTSIIMQMQIICS